MRTQAIFLLTLVLAVGIAVLSPRSAITPGTLAHGHQEIAGDCLACHAPFRGTPDARCTSCHAADSIGLARAEPVPGWNPRPGLAGLHRSLTATDCVACHTDHAGSDPASATRPFSHDALEAGARSRCGACHEGNRPADPTHEGLTGECGDCHSVRAWTPAEFDHARVAGTRGCAACHGSDRPADELHRAGAEDCAACHSTRAWTPADFEHDRYFVLDRDHDTRCVTCHDRPGSYKAYTCYGCHEHTPAGMLREHREEGVQNLDNCARCHRAGEGGERGGRGRERDE